MREVTKRPDSLLSATTGESHKLYEALILWTLIAVKEGRSGRPLVQILPRRTRIKTMTRTVPSPPDG